MEFGRDAAIKILKEHKILRAGEKVLWADTPHEDAYKLETRTDAYWLYGFLMPFTAVLSVLIWNRWLAIFILLISFGICTILVFLTFHSRNHKGRKEAYAITNLRVLHYFQSGWAWTQNIDDLYLEQIIDIDMTKSGYISKKYNVGNLFFATRAGSKPYSGGASSVKFTQISDPKKKLEEFRDLIIKQLGGGELAYNIDKRGMKSNIVADNSPDMAKTNKELKEIKEILKRIEKKIEK
jgi:hypothetical protein